MAIPCEIKHSKTTAQLDHLTLHQEPKATIELTMRASFQFIQGTGEYCMVPMVQRSFTSSHPIEGVAEQLAVSRMADIFCGAFVPSVRDHWFQWGAVNLPASMKRRLVLDAKICAGNADGNIPFLFPAPLTSTPPPSVSQQPLTADDSDLDFSYLADTSYALYSDDLGLLTMNTDPEEEASVDSLMLHLLSTDITMWRRQCFTLEPSPSSRHKPLDTINSTDCPSLSVCLERDSKLLVGSQGINKRIPTAMGTNMRSESHVDDSFTPAAVTHTSALTESVAKNKGHSISHEAPVTPTHVHRMDQQVNGSFTPVGISQPPRFMKVTEKRSP